MALIVQKFGGTSVGSTDKIQAVARRVLASHRQGNRMVVVLSAMSGETDRLIGLAQAMQPIPDPREMDMLLATGEQASVALFAMAVKAAGGEAVSLLGDQVAIHTDPMHTRARIDSIDTERIQRHLDQGRIVTVAGFQGVTDHGDITTLGRGGSDTTAVALAAALKADVCEIYTDVDGIYTADPRVVPRARKMDRISSEEMLELAANGAKVLYIRAVEFARRHGVLIHARSSFSSNEGTLVINELLSEKLRAEGDPMEEPIVAGVATDLSHAKITIVGVPDVPGKAADIFTIVAKAGANVDMIVQNVSAAATGRADISFTLPMADATLAINALIASQAEVGFESLQHDDGIGKLSVVGAGMRTNAGVSAKLFEALSDAGINIEMISTSEIRISVVMRGDKLPEAARVVHTAYGLDSEIDAAVHGGTGR